MHLKVQKLHRDEDLRKKKDSSIQISQIQKLTKFTSYELLPLPFLQVTTSNPPFFGPSNFNLSPIIETFDRVTYTENRWNKQQFRGKLTLLLARSVQLVSGRCTCPVQYYCAPCAIYLVRWPCIANRTTTELCVEKLRPIKFLFLLSSFSLRLLDRKVWGWRVMEIESRMCQGEGKIKFA